MKKQNEIEYLKDRKKEIQKIYSLHEKESKKKSIKSDWCRGVMSALDMEEINVDNRLMEITNGEKTK